MGNPFNFEVEPFEFDTEFDEYEAEQPDTYSEFGEEMEMLGEYEGQPDAYSEFDQETELFDTELVEEVQPNRTQLQRKVQQQRVAHARLKKAIKAMGKFVMKKNGVYRFTMPARNPKEAAARLGIDSSLFVGLLNSMKRRNAQLRSGRLSRSELELEGPSSPSTSSSPACPGHSGIRTYWWGTRMWLNECQVRQVLGMMQDGSGYAAICAALAAYFKAAPAAVVCGVLGGGLTIGAGAVNVIDGLGGNRGIIFSMIRYSVLPGVPVTPVVWHQ